MKKAICVIIFSFWGNCLFSQQMKNDTVQHYCSKMRNLINEISFKSSKVGNNYDIVYHRLELGINPDTFYIKGAVTTWLYAVKDSVTEFSFDLNDALTVDSIVYHNRKISFEHSEEDILTIVLGDTLSEMTLDSLTIYYGGVPEENGFGSIKKGYHDDTPVIWTLSEPYGAKDWWPCKQNLDDKADSIDLIVTSSEDYKAAGNGIVVSEKVIDGKRITHWKHRHPIAAYLVAVAVTNYAVYSEYAPLSNGDSVYVLNYVYPESLENTRAKTTRVLSVIQLYSDLFIPYPFADEKYGHAQFGWGGGMEHQTMSFMGSFSFALMAHELAHQWFGDYITCGSWEDIWLNEGFAVYLEGLTCEHELSDQGWHSWKNELISEITAETGGSVIVEDTSTVSSIFEYRLTYAKAAYLLHMLRWELNDSAFFSGIRNYLNDPCLANNYARTPDLQYHLETAGNTDLTEFFNDWFYGEGYPQYTIYCSQNDENVVSVTIDQTHSCSSVGFFEMHIPVTFSGLNKDTLVVFDHEYSGQEFSFETNFTVNDVFFDPELWILTKNPEINLISDNNNLVLKILPNPVIDEISFVLSKHIYTEKINFYDISGRLVKAVDVGSYIREYTVNISQLQTGTYFMQIVSKKQVNIVAKFIK